MSNHGLFLNLARLRLSALPVGPWHLAIVSSYGLCCGKEGKGREGDVGDVIGLKMGVVRFMIQSGSLSEVELGEWEWSCTSVRRPTDGSGSGIGRSRDRISDYKTLTSRPMGGEDRIGTRAKACLKPLPMRGKEKGMRDRRPMPSPAYGQGGSRNVVMWLCTLEKFEWGELGCGESLLRWPPVGCAVLLTVEFFPFNVAREVGRIENLKTFTNIMNGDSTQPERRTLTGWLTGTYPAKDQLRGGGGGRAGQWEGLFPNGASVTVAQKVWIALARRGSAKIDRESRRPVLHSSSTSFAATAAPVPASTPATTTSATTSTSSSKPRKPIARPRGLWKARGTNTTPRPPTPGHASSSGPSYFNLSPYPGSGSGSTSRQTSPSAPTTASLTSDFPLSVLDLVEDLDLDLARFKGSSSNHNKPQQEEGECCSETPFCSDIISSTVVGDRWTSVYRRAHRVGLDRTADEDSDSSSECSSSSSLSEQSTASSRTHIGPPPSKRQRRIASSSPTSSSHGSDIDSRSQPPAPPTQQAAEITYWDYSRLCAAKPAAPFSGAGDYYYDTEKESDWITRSKLMDTSAITSGYRPSSVSASAALAAAAGDGMPRGMEVGTGLSMGMQVPQNQDVTFEMEDWADLKELFAKAAEMYDTHPAHKTIPLLRGVIHECHRFMRAFPDPSALYAAPPPPPREDIQVQPPPHHPYAYAYGRERQKGKQRDQGVGADPAPSSSADPPAPKNKKCKCKDLPTAFHTLLGTTLYFFGCLIHADPSLALPGEPVKPTPYWLAALDVFEIGENLPVKTSGKVVGAGGKGGHGHGHGVGGSSHVGHAHMHGVPEDWRMAVMWGRTLVCVAGEVARRAAARARAVTEGRPVPVGDEDEDEPTWPADSPFAAIVARRPPLSSRVSLCVTEEGGATPHELLQLAQDQFSRGILHMPHPQHARIGQTRFRAQQAAASLSASLPGDGPVLSMPALGSNAGYGHAYAYTSSTPSAPLASLQPSHPPSRPSPPPPPSPPSPPPPPSTFSRAKELYTLATEVLLLSETLEGAEERQTWARWADSVFSQMKMEADVDIWRGVISASRGRCAVVIGSAIAEGVEERLERAVSGAGKVGAGDKRKWEGEGGEEGETEMDVLDSEDARDAREVLGEAIGYLEKAKEALVAGRAEGAGAVLPVGDDEEGDEDEEMIISLEDAESHDEEEEDGEEPTPSSSEHKHKHKTKHRPHTHTLAHLPTPPDEDEDELRTLLAEALLSLANLTVDREERERLYARAEREGGDKFVLDEEEEEGDRMDED
ncbi:hypothetical protein GALMADRAFT_207845 [Galerina marginata CBS 339.88]|uniref:Transcription factor domain-containing protein n=1 Tax=Galerina marginata (strain CBS 339.88) TaxID=685588 RepID=A0A067TEZ4_GALM3|nr:hypothetical protein GALMADRAFT_207845 [Galerina marginata CBS 339.88]